jgi:aspartyl protease family protein
MHYIAFCVGLAIFIGGLAVRYLDHATAPGASPRPASSASLIASTNNPQPAAAPAPPPRGVTVSRDRYGHFAVEGRVDGRRVEFMVDTGASVVSLRESDAFRLGLRVAPRDYTARVSTANGTAYAAPVMLRSVDIGGIVVRDVRALVHPDRALKVNLLGMSYLGRVRFAHEHGRLVIER